MNDYLPSPELLEKIKQFEGLRLTPYFDAAGYTTIGYGHKLPPGSPVPDRITPEQANAYLAADAASACAAVRSLVKVPMTQAQCDALTDFVFNLGPRALATSTMLRYVNAGDWANAAQQCLLWNHAHVHGQLVVLPGLTLRRQWEASQMNPAPASQPSAQPAAVPAPASAPAPAHQPSAETIIEKVEEAIHSILG